MKWVVRFIGFGSSEIEELFVFADNADDAYETARTLLFASRRNVSIQGKAEPVTQVCGSD